MMALAWSRQAQPIPLTAVGMPGCSAEIVPDGLVYVQGAGGNAVWELPIPNLIGLVGLRFHNQAIVFDPTLAVLEDG